MAIAAGIRARRHRGFWLGPIILRMNQENLSPPLLTRDFLLPDGVASLEHWGLIRLLGEDSAKFLHGQLTQDFALLKANQARLAAFCSAKGRVQASFVGIKRNESEVLLLCHKDLLAPTLKRLSMFVLRAKTRLSDATGEFRVLGLSGTATLGAPDGVASAPWTGWQSGAAQVVQLYPADGVARQLWVAPLEGESAPAGPSLSNALWQWGEVRSGIATVSAAVAELYVPQMLNYESVGGVNFKKGCYPGQEVVARSQFRGTLKRRTYLVHCEAGLAPGQEVFDTSDAEQSVGSVVQAAANPTGGFDALVSLQISAAEAGSLALGGPEGAALALLPLPYSLLTDI